MGGRSGGAASGGGIGRQRSGIGGPELGNLTANQESAVKHYIGPGYTSMNEALRSGGASSPEIQAMRSALDRNLGTAMTVYRGYQSQDLHDLATAGQLKGATITEKGFLSTSTSPTVARRYEHRDGPIVRLKIEAPARAKGAALGKRGIRADKEVVFQAGTKLKVTKVGWTTKQNSFTGARERVLRITATIIE